MTRAEDTCIAPAEITPEDIIAYVEDEGSVNAKRHIERCAFCSKEAQSHKMAQRLMYAALRRRSCIPTIKLGEYVLGVLSPEETREVAAHLVDCRDCKEEMGELSAFLNEPDDILPESGILASLRRLFAVPRNAPAAAMAGLRGVAAPEHVTYDADDWVIHLDVQAGAPGRRAKVVAGMVEQRSGDAPAAVVGLYSEDALLQSQEIDDLGNFTFGDVAPGSYRLELRTEDAEIIIDPFEVR